MVALNAYIRKESSQIINISFYLKELEKKQNIKPKTSRQKEIIKAREKINEIDNNNGGKGESMKPKASSLERPVKYIKLYLG